MTQLSYAWEQYAVAALTLGSSDRPLRERLADAFASRAARVDETDELPPELGERIRAVYGRLTDLPAAGDEGTIRASVFLLPEDEVAALVDEIIWIALGLAEAVGHDRGARGLSRD